MDSGSSLGPFQPPKEIGQKSVFYLRSDDLTIRTFWDRDLAKPSPRGLTPSVVRFLESCSKEPLIGFWSGLLVLARAGRWTSEWLGACS